MKYILLNSLLFIISILGYSQNSKLTENEIVSLEKKSYSKKINSLASTAINNYDIIYHQCNWEIDPGVNYIKGNIKSYFKPKVNGFNQLEFDLSDTLTVDSVKYHHALISFTHLSGDILNITFPNTININALDSVTIYYQGKPSSTGFGSFNQSWHGTSPIIWTLSEPYGAKDWWPCKQNLVDKIDSIDIVVTVPQVNRAASNGKLVSEITIGTNKIYHWKSKFPIAAYLVGVAVTNYTFYSDYVPLQNGSLEVLNYVYPNDLALAQSLSSDIVKIITLYDSLTIEYPFASEKYGHAQFDWGGGMEHQTMSFVQHFDFPLLAHECAHQWFGDYITCGSWEDIWLNEGFATYFEGLTVQRYFPNNWMAWKQGRLTNITSSPIGSVFCNDTTSVNRIFDGRLTYDKGAYLLNMLRWKLGDVVFFNSLKNYLNDPTLKNKYAKTPNFKSHLETTSGQNLTNFFNQWYYNQGYPSYQINWNQNANTLTITINQTQSHSSVSFFEMPVPIKFIGTTKDTTLVFNHAFSGQTFTSTINFPITSVQFDPELWLISANNSITVGISEISFNDIKLKIYPNPVTNYLKIDGFPLNCELEKIQIIDILGKIVYTDVNHYKTSEPTIINTDNFKTGIYHIILSTNLGKKALRFIKE